MPLTVSIDAMEAEVRRELGFRSRVYPRWVQQAKIRPEKAAEQTERLQAVLEALGELRLMRDLERCANQGDPEGHAQHLEALSVHRRERSPLTMGAHAKVAP